MVYSFPGHKSAAFMTGNLAIKSHIIRAIPCFMTGNFGPPKSGHKKKNDKLLENFPIIYRKTKKTIKYRKIIFQYFIGFHFMTGKMMVEFMWSLLLSYRP